MTTKETSEKWDITERRINVLCKEGRIPGANKLNGRWIIPADASKPADERLKADVRNLRSEEEITHKSGKEYQEYQGKYPVIYVTFKDVKCEDWKGLKDILQYGIAFSEKSTCVKAEIRNGGT